MAKTTNVVKTVSRKQVKWRVAGIAVLFVVSLAIVLPGYVNRGITWVNAKTNLGVPTLPANGFNLGLDLQGGVQLQYAADVSDIAPADRADSVEGVRDVIERRVRGGLGVSEPLVQTTRVGEEYRVIVELPGVTDVKEAIKLIGETPVLEFKEQNSEPTRKLTDAEKKELSDYNTAANKKIKTALAEVKKTKDFLAAVAKYSEDSTTTIAKNGDLGFIDEMVYPEIYKWAATAKDGATSDVVSTSDGLNIIKKIASRDGEKEVKASHILICYKGATMCDKEWSKEDAKAKIDALKVEATAENFAELAKANSTESGASKTGGDLGTFGKGATVQAFEDAVYAAKVGEIVGPVETEYGYHLIYKTGEVTPKEYEVARIFVDTKTELDIIPPTEEWKTTGLTGSQLKRAEVLQNSQSGEIEVSLQFDDEGTKLFSDITTRNVGKPVAIYLDGEAISVPTVNTAITDGSAVITGGFTWDEAKLLAQRLNSGALPVPVELISQQKIDASLGSDSLKMSFKAGVIGLIFVILFMILYYRLPGAVSTLALLVYTALTLAIFKLIGFTLTLSGIAGFILSIGMAVDANVLVFERLKEELSFGKGLRAASEEAFMRAWTSIRDSNITTMISCVFLIWMGTGFIKGFAVILLLGVLVSMFTAIIVTRNLMRWVFGFFKHDNANWMFLGHKKNDSVNKPQ